MQPWKYAYIDIQNIRKVVLKLVTLFLNRYVGRKLCFASVLPVIIINLAHSKSK